jgi:starch synthase (maltosyl-transferring)
MLQEPSALESERGCLAPQVKGACRVIIEGVTPEIDGGRFAIKRVPGEVVEVTADIFADSHDVLSAVLKYRMAGEEKWRETPMTAGVNDVWSGVFTVEQVGVYQYTIEAWVNHFRSWRRDLEKKHAAAQDVSVELLTGLRMIRAAAEQTAGVDRQELETAAQSLSAEHALPMAARVAIAGSPGLAELVDAYTPRTGSTSYENELRVTVDPPLARFGAWYELFPRSCAKEPGRHGTFKDCEAWLPRIAEMGFDVVYLPPVHPIGRAFRKGRNNALVPEPTAPGSPWAIGAAEGGHKSVHPELGTLEDFRELVAKARALKLETALDIAFQCSPDHPWVREHPEWFRHRADGSIQYAENPPKKYQDIYPLNFETPSWRSLWEELRSVFEFWIEHGVRVFRVDNPHTKPFRFWQWCIGDLKAKHPELIFLSEAFTRPKVMYYLAKLGFTQSYNYFPWRNTKYELTAYFTELTERGVREFFRPNLWPNTPDILTEYLQFGGHPAFVSRLVLAATLGASYGIYGPPFELCENTPREPGSEEYLDSEKYEIRNWDWKQPGSFSDLISRVNHIRHEHPALQSDSNLEFHPVDNENLIAYSKRTPDNTDIILTVVNLDPHHVQRGWLEVSGKTWELSPNHTYQLHDLLTGARFLWAGPRNYVELNPAFAPAHVMHLRRYVRTERDFDYFL